MLQQIATGPPTAIVILAAGRRTYAPEFGAPYNETIDALTLERVRYGAFLASRTNLPILVSGGLTPVSLARLMAETLKADYGIMPRWIETESRNTAENAIFSSMMLKRDGVRRVLLVTHAWHMKRALAAFVSNGMAVTPAPTAFYFPDGEGFWPRLIPSLARLRMSGYAAHEIAGVMWYRIRYGY